MCDFLRVDVLGEFRCVVIDISDLNADGRNAGKSRSSPVLCFDHQLEDGLSRVEGKRLIGINHTRLFAYVKG